MQLSYSDCVMNVALRCWNYCAAVFMRLGSLVV